MASEKQFIVNLLESDVKAELLILFHKNPGLVDTIEGVARRIGRHDEQIRTAVEEFKKLGLIDVRNYGGVAILSLNWEKDREVQQTVFDHVSGYFERRRERN